MYRIRRSIENGENDDLESPRKHSKDVSRAAVDRNYSAAEYIVYDSTDEPGIDARNQNGETLAHLSAAHGRVLILHRYMKENKTFTNAVDNLGNTISCTRLRAEAL